MKFSKYHGTGNDFVMIDGFNHNVDYKLLSKDFVAHLCHRRFGVGADGLIVLVKSDKYDFKMVYYNSDGSESTMCGNGARCLVKFASDLGYINNTCTFEAIDGKHEGRVDGLVSVKMIDVDQINDYNGDFVVNTGSPHYLKFVEDVNSDSFVTDAKSIRYNDTFNKEGINVNFIKKIENKIHIRTFERGVEDETYSCGTGVVAASIVASKKYSELNNNIEVITKGGSLSVSFEKNGDSFQEIWLTGPAVKVFDGDYIN